ncbi:MAG: hypothetical protein FWD72_00425, partial [Eggerthellaceae bacterium]|nr:hypothetical protein [Eggerthellaceae bacterium]
MKLFFSIPNGKREQSRGKSPSTLPRKKAKVRTAIDSALSVILTIVLVVTLAPQFARGDTQPTQDPAASGASDPTGAGSSGDGTGSGADGNGQSDPNAVSGTSTQSVEVASPDAGTGAGSGIDPLVGDASSAGIPTDASQLGTTSEVSDWNGFWDAWNDPTVAQVVLLNPIVRPNGDNDNNPGDNLPARTASLKVTSAPGQTYTLDLGTLAEAGNALTLGPSTADQPATLVLENVILARDVTVNGNYPLIFSNESYVNTEGWLVELTNVSGSAACPLITVTGATVVLDKSVVWDGASNNSTQITAKNLSITENSAAVITRKGQAALVMLSGVAVAADKASLALASEGGIALAASMGVQFGADSSLSITGASDAIAAPNGNVAFGARSHVSISITSGVAIRAALAGTVSFGDNSTVSIVSRNASGDIDTNSRGIITTNAWDGNVASTTGAVYFGVGTKTDIEVGYAAIAAATLTFATGASASIQGSSPSRDLINLAPVSSVTASLNVASAANVEVSANGGEAVHIDACSNDGGASNSSGMVGAAAYINITDGARLSCTSSITGASDDQGTISLVGNGGGINVTNGSTLEAANLADRGASAIVMTTVGGAFNVAGGSQLTLSQQSAGSSSSAVLHFRSGFNQSFNVSGAGTKVSISRADSVGYDAAALRFGAGQGASFNIFDG